jgi:hypothetical protein
MGRVAAPVTAELAEAVSDFRTAIRADEPNLGEASLEFQAALVMGAAMHSGFSNLNLLSRATGVPYAKVVRFAKNFRRGGVWRDDGKIELESDPNSEPDQTSLELWLLVLVAIGKVRRFPAGEGGTPLLAASDPAEERPDEPPDESGPEDTSSP